MPGDDDEEEVEDGLFVSLVVPEGAVAGVDSLTFQYGDDGGQVREYRNRLGWPICIGNCQLAIGTTAARLWSPFPLDSNSNSELGVRSANS